MSDVNDVKGFCESEFEPLKNHFANNLKTGVDVGASLAVNIKGKFVVDLWGGYANAEKTRPWEEDTIVNVFSTTKIMAALCIHVLADRGQLDFDSPVANYWPEFAQAGKEKLPVKYLLSHSSGLSGWDAKIEMKDFYNWEKVTNLLASQRPWWEPGTKSGYHMITFGYLLGELVRRITGKTLSEFFKEEITAPLGADFHIGFGKELDFRVADLIPAPPPNLFQRVFFKVVGYFLKKSIFMKTFSNFITFDIPQVNSRDWRAAEIPAANGHGNARSIAKIGSILVNGGELNGVRIISRKAIEKSIEEQISGKDLVLRVPLRFGLGWGLINDHVRDLMDLDLSPRTFYWGGHGGSLCVMDPDKELCMAFAMNKLNPETLGDERIKGLMNTLIKIIH